MARYPTARWDPAGTPGGPITPRVIILHSEATPGGLAHPQGEGGNGLEWHFMVRYDGTVLQHVDTGQRADANRDANGFAISIETEDNGDPDHEPWTDKQLVAIVDLVAWCCDTHGIPRTQCDRWDGHGIGFHTMWGAPSHWTPVRKTCPGAARKAQFPLILDRLAGAGAASIPEDDMTPVQEAKLDRLLLICESAQAGDYGERQGFAGGSLGWLDRRLDAHAGAVTAAVVDAVAKATGHELDAKAIADDVIKGISERLAS